MEDLNLMFDVLERIMGIFGPIGGALIVVFVLWLWAGKPKIFNRGNIAPTIEPLTGGNGKTRSLPVCGLHPVFAEKLGNIEHRLEKGDERFEGVALNISNIKENVATLLERTKE